MNMYSASNGQKLGQLPELDGKQLEPQEPLKRTSDEPKKRQRRHNNDVFCETDSTANQDHTNLTIANATEKVSSNSRGTNSSTGSNQSHRGGRGKKPHQELLSDKQKRANHIASEQKRRANIRTGYDQLSDIVPTLSHCHKSESLILQKSYDYIQHLLDNKTDLKGRIRELQLVLGDTPDEDSSDDGDEHLM